MPYYLYQVAYTYDAWTSMLKNPQNRTEAIRPIIERLGGRIDSRWIAFGEYDVVGICEMPDNVSAAAFSMAVSSGGAVKAFKTTPLMTIDEGIQAMRTAGDLGYKPPTE
jgi:uncharacterized protein with GYD domain